MALNQHRQYFSAYSSPDIEIQSPLNKKDFTKEKTYKKISPIYKSLNLEISKQTENHNSSYSTENSLISETKMYALKKRLLLPSWLLEGVLLQLGTKEPWFESIACSRMGKIFASPSNISVKSIIPFFLVWNELVGKIFDLNSTETIIKLQLNKFITGTKKDIQEISKDVENLFSSPLKLFEIKPAKKTKAFSMSKIGSLNFIRHAQLENDVDGIWLTLNLTHSFRDICYPPELKSEVFLESNNIVSISPVVIQSMGSRANLKKILNYLFLEYSKQASYLNHSNWSSFRIDCKKISVFHRDFLSTAPALYDHGVLGWNNCAPNKKISDIKDMNISPNRKHEIICSWQLSDQIKEAFEIEHEISEKIVQKSQKYFETIESNEIKLPKESSKIASLFPEPPEDQLKKAREERELKKLNQEKEQAARMRLAEKRAHLRAEVAMKKMNKKVMTQTLFDDGLLNKKSPISESPSATNIYHDELPTKQTFVPSIQNDLGDNEFLVLVSEFYESLKPTQKKAFERDRKGMSCEQFKAYMSSILQRKKSVPL